MEIFDLLEDALWLDGLNVEGTNRLNALGSVPVVAPLVHLWGLVLLEHSTRNELSFA